MGYSFRLAARVLLYASSHRQDGLCYTSRGALAGTRNSSIGPPHEGSIRRPIAPWANALTTELHLAPIYQKTPILSWDNDSQLTSANQTNGCQQCELRLVCVHVLQRRCEAEDGRGEWAEPTVLQLLHVQHDPIGKTHRIRFHVIASAQP